MKFLLAVATGAAVVNADIYMQNVAGSNNRLDEANRDRNNGNRLYDSQNNNRGGYNVGNYNFIEQSQIDLEWTNQHTCGNPQNNCEIVFQYMCDPLIRDGTTTNTIPVKPIKCIDWDCDTDVRYGRHESWSDYMSCQTRERNKGLFTATQKLKGDTAKYTRQNPNGARRGYECPEERDYYPYWHPTSWRDVAVLTNQAGRCDAYKAESQNVAPRYYCDLPHTSVGATKQDIPISQAACEAITYSDINGTAITGRWALAPAFGIPAPECHENWWSRDNHLGNVEGGQMSSYKWTVPSGLISDNCILRIRYNISTGDMPHFDDDAAVTTAALTSELNGEGRGGRGQTGPAKVDIASKYGITDPEEIKKREYNLQNNPQVDIFGSIIAPPANAEDEPRIQLQLAVNTAQFGRTFQDRTHRFSIKKLPSALVGANIQNVMVRGKRGNIVQTFPAHEYDFTPNDVNCKNGDYLNFQWIGSNTEPKNNAGQGRQGTDRSNIVMLRPRNYEEAGQKPTTVPPTYGHLGNSYPSRTDDNTAPFLGLSSAEKGRAAVYEGSGELSELDDAGTYYNLGPKMCSQNGIYNYLSTRNNNFSNRSQKARATVSDSRVLGARIGATGGSIANGDDSVEISAMVVTGPSQIVLKSYGPEHDTGFDGTPDSNVVEVSAVTGDGKMHLVSGGTITVSVSFEDQLLHSPTMYRADSLNGPWTEIEDAEFNDGKATAQVNSNGYYLVESNPNVLAIILIALVSLLAVVAGGWLCAKKMCSTPALTKAETGGV